MGLKIWLPLKGSLRNQGTDSGQIITNNNVVSNSSGKIGSCYEFNGSNSYLIGKISSISNNTSEWTYACWFKPKNSHQGCLFSCRTAVAETGITIFYYSGNFYIDDGVRWNFTPSTTLVANTWYHIAVVRKKNVGKFFYINGVLTNSTTTTGTPTKVSTTNFSIGSSQSTATTVSNNYLNGYLNDVRFYDHALSEQEIKKIAQGLIVHYPLNRNGWGQENLLPLTDFNGISKKFTLTSGTEGGFTFTPTTTITPSTNYTISCRIRGNANINLYRLNTGGNESTAWINRSELSTTNYKDFFLTFASPNSNKTMNQVYICTRYGTANSQIGDWFEIEPYTLKLELGNKATLWCPNSSDPFATLLGMNRTVVKDISGYQNNGSITGVLTSDSDSIKYDVCTYFKDYTNFISCSLGDVIPNAITMSCWIKSINKTPRGNYHLPLNMHSTNYEISIVNSGKPRMGYVVGGSRYVSDINLDVLDGKWHMLTSTFNGNKICRYVDGILVGSENRTGALTTLGTLGIGQFPPSGTNYGNTELYESDVRVYSTALSADEIKQLYEHNIVD